MSTLTHNNTLTIIECGACHITFAMPRSMYKSRIQDGKRFYCPNGCHISYYETENMRLQRQVADEQENVRIAQARAAQERREAEAARRRAAAARGQVTKIKKRVHNGVCPHCNRTFANVARHMASKHAEVPV